MSNLNFELTRDVSLLLKKWSSQITSRCIQRHKKIDVNLMMRMMISNTYINNPSISKCILECDDSFDKSSFSRFRKKIPYIEFENLYQELQKLISKYQIFPQEDRIIAVDGSKFQIDARMIKEGYQIHSRLAQGHLNVALDLKTGIPVASEFGSDRDERKYLLNLIHSDKLDKGSFILADRGYYSEDLFCSCSRKGLIPIFRLPRNLRFIKELNKNKSSDGRYILNGDTNIRVIRYIHNGKDVFIGTTLDSEYSIEKIKEFYQMRWDIEEYFKLLKVNSGFCNLTSRSENNIKQELYLHMFLITYMKAICKINQGILGIQKDPNDSRTFKKFNCSSLLFKIKKNIFEMFSSSKITIKKIVSSTIKTLKTNQLTIRVNRSYPVVVKRYTTKEKYNNVKKKTKNAIDYPEMSEQIPKCKKPIKITLKAKTTT